VYIASFSLIKCPQVLSAPEGEGGQYIVSIGDDRRIVKSFWMMTRRGEAIHHKEGEHTITKRECILFRLSLQTYLITALENQHRKNFVFSKNQELGFAQPSSPRRERHCPKERNIV
jgi:hypothetical protein